MEKQPTCGAEAAGERCQFPADTASHTTATVRLKVLTERNRLPERMASIIAPLAYGEGRNDD